MSNIKFHLKTFGCQMNVYDSSRIVDLLQLHNMQQVDDELDADVIILNTC